MKLNLGCGGLRIPGFVGVDLRPGPGVDVVVDLASFPWPFPDSSVDEVVAWHVMEHLVGNDFSRAVEEIARILRPGGLLYVKVPYGLRGLYFPHHHRAFNRHTFDPFVVNAPGSDGDPCLQSDHGLFRRERQEVVYSPNRFPGWHVVRYLPGVARRLFDRDERGWSCRFPAAVPWGSDEQPQRELREWLVRL